MKKLFATLLAIIMLASMTVTAFASENTGATSTPTDITVNGSFVSGTAGAETISADIAWEAMDFTYTGASQGTWNPATHTYDGATEGGWSDNTPAITVTNHSNVAVNATLGFTASVTGVVGTFTEASGTANDGVLELATAEGTTLENAPKATANFGISGAAIDADKTLGTITVTIAKTGSAEGGETDTGVTTFTELQAAVNNGGTVKLGGDITLEDFLNIDATSPLILDLNGHTITGAGKSVYLNSGTCTIRGGSINVTGNNAVGNNGGTLTIDQCTISAGQCALYNGSGDATVKNSTLSRTDNWYVVYADKGTVSLEGTVDLSGTIKENDGGKVTVLPGTYNFDPTSYVDANAYTVTDNGDGTWMVAVRSEFDIEGALANGTGNIVLTSDVTVDTPYLVIQKDVSIDFNGNTLRGSIMSSGNIGDPPNNLVLRDPNNNGEYSIYSKIYGIENGNGQAAAIIANQTNITIESGKYTNDNAVILCAQIVSDPNDVGVMINGGTFDGRDGASVIVNVYGNVIVNDGEFNAYSVGERSGACVHVEPGITYVPSITTINGGTFNADKSIFYVNVDTNYIQKIIVTGGTFNVAEGGSLIEVSSGNASDYLTITGGTFNVDPTAYVDANAYTVTDNGDGTWTVAEK